MTDANIRPIQLPEIQCAGADDELLKEVRAILYALMLIRQETGHGTLVIEVKESRISEMRAEHVIRPKYLKL
jgi:hypothetical protein